MTRDLGGDAHYSARRRRIVRLALAGFLTLLLQATSAEQAAAEVGIRGLPDDLRGKAPVSDANAPNLNAAYLQHYLEQHGYLLATVSHDDDGDLIVDLGSISSITVTGLGPKNESTVRRILADLNEGPVLEGSLDRALALINDLHGVSATVALNRLEDGSFNLYVAGAETWQFGGVALDNTPQNLGEEYRINLHQDLYGLIVGGDVLRLQVVDVFGGDDPEKRSFVGSYQFPVGADGAYLEVGAADFQTETEIHSRAVAYTTLFGTTVVPGSVTSHDFEGRTVYVTGGYPVVRRHDRSLYVIGNLDHSRNETETIGTSDVTHGDLGLYFTRQTAEGENIAAGVDVGPGYSDSYIAGADAHYLTLEIMGAYIRPVPELGDFTELRLEGFGQLGSSDTPSSKLLGLGDRDFLRGYESSTILGASGAAGTAELAHAYYFTSEIVRRVAPFAFFDIGHVRNASRVSNDTNRPDQDTLASTGVGARVDFANRFGMESYVAAPLSEKPNGETPGASMYLRLMWSW